MVRRNNLAERLSCIDFSKFKIFTGYDATVDHIARPIREVLPEKYSYYSEIAELGDAITSKKALSGVISIKHKTIKVGGNMPNYANALGVLGVTVDCIGPFGLPEIESVYEDLPNTCRLHSIGASGMCVALEFNDGKLMIEDTSLHDSITWSSILDAVGKDRLYSMCKESDLVALANWSEIKNATDIWRETLNMLCCFEEKKYVSIDITDFSYRSQEDVQELIILLKEIVKHTNCILTLNRNEATMLHKHISQVESEETIAESGASLFEFFAPHMLVIHTSRKSYAWTAEQTVECDSYYTENIVINTGTGDNFNAGLSAGIIAGLSVEECLLLANSLSGYYVRHGFAPDVAALCKFIEEYKQCNP